VTQDEWDAAKKAFENGTSDARQAKIVDETGAAFSENILGNEEAMRVLTRNNSGLVVKAYNALCDAIKLKQLTGAAKSEYKLMLEYAAAFEDAMTSEGIDFVPMAGDDEDIDKAVAGQYNDTKYSRKKSYYNDFATNAMIWARSGGTQVGDTRVFYDGYRDKWVAVEKTEDSMIELGAFSYYQEGAKFAEEWENDRKDEGIYKSIESYGDANGTWDGSLLNDERGRIENGQDGGLVQGKSASDGNTNNKESTGDSGTRYSIKRINSEGNTVTDAQYDYFKKSKVVDDEGNLLVVYHGTDSDFTVFDVSKGRPDMDIQGMFFSPDKNDALGYGTKAKAYYLNIINPADFTTGFNALKRFRAEDNAGIKARELLISEGYDGVNNGDEYIAFYPEQIKLIENKSPTSSDDIRFSVKKQAYTYDETKAIVDKVADGLSSEKYDVTVPKYVRKRAAYRLYQTLKTKRRRGRGNSATLRDSRCARMRTLSC